MDIFVEGRIGLNDLTKDHHFKKYRSKDPTKNMSFADKLNNVKVMQSERRLNVTKRQLEKELNTARRKLRDDTNDVSYDFRGMQVSIKEQELQVKREQDPESNFEDDEFEIAQQKKYLVYDPNKWFYLARKNNHPLRSSSNIKPSYISPTLAKARKLLEDMDNHRRVSAQRCTSSPIRKGTHSVHFQDPIQGDNTEDKPRELERKPSAAYVRSSKTPVDHMMDRLRKEKAGRESVHSLYSVLLDDKDEDIPDDYTQLQLEEDKAREKQRKKQFKTSTPYTDEDCDDDENDDDMSTVVPSLLPNDHEKRPTASAVSRGAVSMISRTTLPNVEEDLTADELYLLRASPIKRLTASAPSQHEPHSANQLATTRQDIRSSHALVRIERERVEQKVAAFLDTLDREKEDKIRAMRSKGIFDPQLFIRPSPSVRRPPPQTSLGLSLETSKTQQSLTSGVPQRNSISSKDFTAGQRDSVTLQKKIRGAPRSRETRSGRNRSVVVNRLQNMMKSFQETCSFQQLMEIELMRKRMQEGDNTS